MGAAPLAGTMIDWETTKPPQGGFVSRESSFDTELAIYFLQCVDPTSACGSFDPIGGDEGPRGR